MSAEVIFMMLGVSTLLGGIALYALLWGLKTGQFDDQAKFIDAARYDNEEDLRDAVKTENKKKEMLEKKRNTPPD